jgi:DNA polymerase-3 subunit gamma/tau
MSQTPYRVLARKYRPRRFDDLVGQEVLVRTLSNAFSSGRIAHAFLLTGIRGIGKTTTARIIARGLNCIGPDGEGGPTTSPCGECPNCQMILEDRHVDIIEMDAASRTGVDDIREIIDTVHYAPANARYKIYIIDEVHMLSKNAFNALLKTLEEPPAHVKFIFATTELRKLPVTIVSRCQRFDLRRLDIEMLAGHLGNICAQEQVEADAESLKLIATAAEGSVRDALSLLDQTIAMHTDETGATKINEVATRDMLGMADKSRLIELLQCVFEGDAKAAIEQLRAHHERGNEATQLFHDMLGLLHYLTRIKVDASLTENLAYSDLEQQSAKGLAEKIAMPILTRAWQMTLKGLDELKAAPHPLSAAEMILIRLCYAASLPTPDKMIRELKNAPANTNAQGAQMAPAATAPQPVAQHRGNLALATAQAAPVAAPQAQPKPQEQPESFLEVVALFQEHKEVMLYSHLFNDVRLVSFDIGRIEVIPTEHIPADFAARVGRHLREWCGQPWQLSYANADAQSEPSLREQARLARQKMLDYAASHPHVQKVITLFEGAELIDVTEIEDLES